MQLTVLKREFMGPYLPIGEYGPYRERPRQRFEGAIWRFRAGWQWRQTPTEFGVCRLAPGAWCLAPGAWRLASGAWRLVDRPQ
ncbi:hypothetical protein [Streptomyces sp. NPDC093097]|uniref:hypothetical protein n=1 Tax=Streptomyces sp. NPDC093097 TaxID=3366027 RepID=UPI0037FDBC89